MILEKKKRELLINYYKSYGIDKIGYGTVKDYSDSKNNLEELIVQGDLKDFERPWCVKAIINKLPIGAKIIEIGGGEPLVANFLAELGYIVYLVDPYDGSGNGPIEYDYYKKKYPKVQIVKNYFNDGLTNFPNNFFDAIFSVSVLEHVSDENLLPIYKGINKFLKPGGFSIHTVDVVLMGNKDVWHKNHAKKIVKLEEINTDLDVLFKDAHEDPDTYFLSANGHLLWKGATPYQDFPFRRCISLNICKQYK